MTNRSFVLALFFYGVIVGLTVSALVLLGRTIDKESAAQEEAKTQKTLDMQPKGIKQYRAGEWVALEWVRSDGAVCTLISRERASYSYSPALSCE